MAEEWAPDLAEVADYVPTRTVPTTGVGAQEPAGTFNANTTPTDTQAQRFVDRAVAWVLARTGSITESLHAAAKDVAALRAAGLIELSYPVRDADVNTAEQLLAQADRALAELVSANTGAGGGQPGTASQLLPLHNFPPPHPYGDVSPL